MENITVHSIEPAKKKTGEYVEGVSKNGKNWKLYKINQKYSYFHYGEDEPEFQVGEVYEFTLEEREKDGFVNYTLSIPRKGDAEKAETDKTFDDMRRAFAKHEKEINDLRSEFKLLKEFLNQ